MASATRAASDESINSEVNQSQKCTDADRQRDSNRDRNQENDNTNTIFPQ
jgi:hypothetical protein